MFNSNKYRHCLQHWQLALIAEPPVDIYINSHLFSIYDVLMALPYYHVEGGPVTVVSDMSTLSCRISPLALTRPRFSCHSGQRQATALGKWRLRGT